MVYAYGRKFLLVALVMFIVKDGFSSTSFAMTNESFLAESEKNTPEEVVDVTDETPIIEGRVIAYITNEATAELDDSFLQPKFISNYFGITIAEVEDLTASTKYKPNKQLGLLLALTMGEGQSSSHAIQVLKESTIIEFTQIEGLINYRLDFVPDMLIIELTSDAVRELRNSFQNPQIASSTLGLDIIEVKFSIDPYSGLICQDNFLMNLSLGGKRTFL